MSQKSFIITTIVVGIYIDILVSIYGIFWFNQNIRKPWQQSSIHSLFIEQLQANIYGAMTNYIIHEFIISIYLLKFLQLPDMCFGTYVNYVFNNNRRLCFLNTFYIIFLMQFLANHVLGIYVYCQLLTTHWLAPFSQYADWYAYWLIVQSLYVIVNLGGCAIAQKLPDFGFGIILKHTQEEDGILSAEACCGEKESVSVFSDCRVFNEKNLQRLETGREIIFSDLVEAPLFSRTIVSPDIPRMTSINGFNKLAQSANKKFYPNPSLLSQDTPVNPGTNRNKSSNNISVIKPPSSKQRESIRPDWSFSKSPSLVGLFEDNKMSIGNLTNCTFQPSKRDNCTIREDEYNFNPYVKNENTVDMIRDRGKSFLIRAADRYDIDAQENFFTIPYTADRVKEFLMLNSGQVETESEKWVGECNICYGNFVAGVNVSMLPLCFHVFHTECLRDWFLQNANCPCCRNYIRRQMVQFVHQDFMGLDDFSLQSWA